MQIKAIIFDLDNTLIDFMTMKRLSCEAAIDAMIHSGLKVSKNRALKKVYAIYEKTNIEDHEIFQKLLNKLDKKIDYKILASGINAYRQKRAGYLKPYPNARRTIKKLKKNGLKLAIVSDAPKLNAWLRLTAMKLENYFDFVITKDDSKEEKPAKKPFKMALRKLKVKPEECLVVGDRTSRDIKGARKLNMKSAFAKYGSEEKKANADYTLTKIEDLISLMKQI